MTREWCRAAGRDSVKVVRTILLVVLVLGCTRSSYHPSNRTTSTSIQPDTQQVYKARGKLRFINKARPGGGSATTGALEGTAIDDRREPMIGMTVVATSTSLVGEQVVITDEQGKFNFQNLPPGTYKMTYYYINASFENPKVVVRAGMTTTEDIVDFPASKASSGHLL